MRNGLSRFLADRSVASLTELYEHWVGGTPPSHKKELITVLQARMTDPSAASSVRATLGAAEETLLLPFLERGGGTLDAVKLTRAASRSGLAPYQVDSAIAALEALGLLGRARRGRDNGTPQTNRFLLPREIASALNTGAELSRRPSQLLTLRGHLEQGAIDAGEEPDGSRLRRTYRFLAGEQAICSRIDALDEPLQRLVVHAITRSGGIITAERLTEDGFPVQHPRDLAQELERVALGSVGMLDLEHRGIRQRSEVVVIFSEVVVAYLRHEAQSNPAAPDSSASIGVDFVSDFSRFAARIGSDDIRFTVRGRIFESTGKRIAADLLPNPGREYTPRELLDLLYRFAVAHRHIEKAGTRTFLFSAEGQEFLRGSLHDKLRAMLDWMVEDRSLPGDLPHQLILRRTALRYLKRLEPGVWYDAMFLPFIVRNHYLATDDAVDPREESRARGPRRSTCDTQSLAWNLFVWIRKRLYVLGILDLGYDEVGRATAIRLTQLGADLLEMMPGRELSGAGHLVINSDFEVVLFPDINSHQLIYRLDQFCDREMADRLIHFRITPESLRRGLEEGVSLESILELLTERSRTPIPQNVDFSLHSWSREVGSQQ